MHVAGTQNIAADFLSRIDPNPEERVELKIRNDITIQPIQVNLQDTESPMTGPTPPEETPSGSTETPVRSPGREAS